MPTYYKGGYEPKNKTKVTSARYFIKRLGLIIDRRWGSVELTGHTYKKFNWSKGKPATKEDSFETVEEAKAFMLSHEKRVIRQSYQKIPHVINF